MESAKGTPSPDDRYNDELENLNLLTDLGAMHFHALILIADRITTQVEGVFDEEGIQIDASDDS